ncbi:MAG: hypothetical protein KDF65_12505, partial [Anaerolineae bacterium]|nr:hypothetical protein [Anaerolineae bacterium]
VVGGLLEPGNAHLIRVGRSWDGNTANQGSWSGSDGYRTLVHEFGHYALGLYDEYFGYELIGGELAGRKEAYCLSPANREAAGEATNASIMDYHYTSSELADVTAWHLPSAWCRETAQHLLNNGEADWQTLQRLFGDAQSRWRLVGPDERAGAGQVVAGPAQLPATLPFPTVSYTNAGADPLPFAVQVCRNGELYLAGAWITLVSAGGQTIDQGVTDDSEGRLTILGAGPNDTLQVVSLDGTLSASQRSDRAQRDGFITLTSGANLSATALGQEVRHRLSPDRTQLLFSSDGILSLLLPPGALAPAEVELVVATPGGLPGPLPAGLAPAGSVYQLTTSTGETQLARPALLSLPADAALGRRFAPDSLAIYRWAAELNQWQPLPDQTSDERQEVSGPIRQLGLYALLGPPQTLAARAGATVCSSAAGAIELIYLPLVLE